jgi:peptidoglycan hydrolase CwlO-like protein
VAIEVTDKELYELLGRKDVEIFSDEKSIEAYRLAVERVKGLATETDALKVAKTSLETSNGQLSSKNIELDRALTEARKERDAAKVVVTNDAAVLAGKVVELNAAKSAMASKTTELDTAKQATMKAQNDVVRLVGQVNDLQTQLEQSALELGATSQSLTNLQLRFDELRASIVPSPKAKPKR